MKFQILVSVILAVSCLLAGCDSKKKTELPMDNKAQITAEANPVVTEEMVAPSEAQVPSIGENQNNTEPESEVIPDSQTIGENQNDIEPESEIIPDNQIASEDIENKEESPILQEDSGINSFGPLSESQRQLLDGIIWDVPPEILNAVKPENEGQHFLKSDERHPELFRESIENIGHTYIGIGTDQGYVYIGWQRPTLAFLVDYDPWVIILHRIYIAFFKACDDSECMLNFFAKRDYALEFLKSIPELSDKTTQTVYKAANKGVTHSLNAIKRMKAKTFMNDPETFQYIKNLINTGRLKTFQANLLGDKAFVSIQSTLNELHAKVGVLYLSNAEQYWAYTKQYKENMLGLPYSDNAMVIRTIATKPLNDDYRYSVQTADVFKTWLEHPNTASVRNIVGRTKFKDTTQEEVIPFTVDNQLPK